eukprot:3135005-Prymnesium_polylepis.1
MLPPPPQHLCICATVERAYALEMGIPRGHSALSGVMGQTRHRAQGKAEAVTALVSAATDSTAAIGSAASLTATDTVVPRHHHRSRQSQSRRT